MSAIDPRLNGGRRQGPDRKLTPERELSLVEDYRSGMKIRLMQERYGLSKKGVYDILKRQGVPTTLRREPLFPSRAPLLVREKRAEYPAARQAPPPPPVQPLPPRPG